MEAYRVTPRIGIRGADATYLYQYGGFCSQRGSTPYVNEPGLVQGLEEMDNAADHIFGVDTTPKR